MEGFYGWTVGKDLTIKYLSLKCNSNISLERRKKNHGILADFCICKLEQVKKGRPCETWRDKVEKDLNIMGINMDRQAMHV